MSYRLSLSKPGAATPYQIIHAREAGTYKPGEIAPLGGKFEVLRGEFGGPGSVKVSAPVLFEAGDWLRIWLKGDADNDPTYLGEVGGEPWQTGAGEIQTRPLKDTVAQARWSGAVQANFAEYLAFVIGHCVLPPGVTTGAIPADLAILKAFTRSELLGDTFQAAMPVIDGGAWGVDNRGRIGVYRPDTELTHRFPRTRSEISPGDTSGYRNAVQFTYARPDGTEAWFEGRIEGEILKRGEVWELSQVSARVGAAADNPLMDLNGTVDIPTKYSGTTTDGTGQTVPFEYPSSYVAHQTAPIFSPDWNGKLSTPGMFKLRTGPHFTPASPAESAITLMLPSLAPPANTPPDAQHVYFPRVAADDHGKPLDQVLEMQTQAGGAWQPVKLMPNNGSAMAGYPIVPRGQTVTIRYTQAHITAYAPYGLQINQGGYAGEMNPATGTFYSFQHVNVSVQMNVAARNDDGQAVSYPAQMQPFIQDTQAYDSNTTLLVESPGGRLGPASPVTITPPAPILLSAGSAVLVSSQYSGDVAGVTLVTPGGDVALTRGITSFDVTSWTYSGNGVTVSAFKVAGNPVLIGRVVPQLVSTATLTAYAYGLLRYRVQPVRSWTGQYKRLKRVPCRGVSRFETMQGEVDLDVQRVTYDLSAGTVSVECGTPQASSDDDATAAAIERVRQEMRANSG